MMDAESIEDPTSSKTKRSTGKPGKRCFPNMPQTLHEQKIKMPKDRLEDQAFFYQHVHVHIYKKKNVIIPE
jgi:hypothetical protein